MLHPRIRIPLWVAPLVLAVAYLGRSALRGYDFRLELPVDAIVLGLFVLVVGLVAFVRATFRDDEDDHSNE